MRILAAVASVVVVAQTPGPAFSIHLWKSIGWLSR